MTALLLPLLLSGCGRSNAVNTAYASARSAAWADPGPAPAGWRPDVRVHVSRAMLDTVIERALVERGAFTGEIRRAGVTLRPEVQVRGLTLGPSTRCEACLAVDLQVEGTLAWAAGLLGEGSLPMASDLAFDVSLDVAREGPAWVLRALPRDLRAASLSVPGWRGAVKAAGEEPLRRWLDREVVSRIEPVAVGRWAAEACAPGTPGCAADPPLAGVRAVAVRAKGTGLVVDLLSTLPGGGDVGSASAAPREGFVVHVAPTTLAAAARRALFAAGPQTHGIVPEPTSLSVNGGRFALGLRLWKTTGRGWWRDYTASGALGATRDSLTLRADDVVEGPKSPGAELADPLFWLGEGLVQRAMQDAIAGSVPKAHPQDLGGVHTLTRLHQVEGVGGLVRITGSIELPARRSGRR